MIPSKHLESVRPMPLERYVTTYSRDYKPLSEPRCEAAAVSSLSNPPQSHRETWPIFHHYFYDATNYSYGSTSRPQPPSCSLFPGSVHPLSFPAPFMFEEPAFVSSSPTEARTQEVGIAREIGPLLGEETKGRLHYVFGGKANMLEQQEAKDVPQKMDVLYEEGVILLSSYDGPACCEDLLSSVCREAGLQHLLNLPVASSTIITTEDAESWDVSAYFRVLELAIGLRDCTVQQHTFMQCSWMKTFPPCSLRSITPPLATFYCTEPSRSSLRTEYQARYTAEWAPPKMQQSVIHHHHQMLYSSF